MRSKQLLAKELLKNINKNLAQKKRNSIKT